MIKARTRSGEFVLDYGTPPDPPLQARFEAVHTSLRSKFDIAPGQAADWEDAGVVEFLVLTRNGYAPHQVALGTVVPTRARVRVIDLLSLDFGSLAEYPDDPVHGGEVDTSLVLFVRPDLVRMESAYDCILTDADLRRYRRGTALRLPAGSPGSVGHPRAASPEKGARFYAYILDRLRSRLFAANPAPAAG